MPRADALRSLYAIMEDRAELVTALDHTLGATKIAGGAKIISQSVYVEQLPKPCIVILGLSSISRENQAIRPSTLTLEVHASDVFQLTEIVDEIQCMCDDWRSNMLTNNPAIIKRIDVTSDVLIPTPDPALRQMASEISVRVEWTERP